MSRIKIRCDYCGVIHRIEFVEAEWANRGKAVILSPGCTLIQHDSVIPKNDEQDDDEQ